VAWGEYSFNQLAAHCEVRRQFGGSRQISGAIVYCFDKNGGQDVIQHASKTSEFLHVER